MAKDTIKTRDADGKAVKCSDLLCAFCTHFYLDMGDPGYSELTPGWSASIECNKGHWEMENGYGVQLYREYIVKARTCGDFVLAST